MLKSKANQTGHNRYGRILDKSEKIPEQMLKFVKDIEKDLDKLLLHTTDPDIPTTNNIIELLFLKLPQKSFRMQKLQLGP